MDNVIDNPKDTVSSAGNDSVTETPQNDTDDTWDYFDPSEDNEEYQEDSTEGEPEDDTSKEDTSENAEEEDSETEDKEVETGHLVMPGGEKLPVQEVINGYMRQRDYSQKTAALADNRRELEEVSNHLHSVQNALIEYLSPFIPPMPDAGLAYSDPMLYTAQKAAHEAAVSRLDQIKYMASQSKAAIDHLDASKNKELLDKEWSMLVEKIPSLKEPKNREKFQKATFEAARNFGFTDEELMNVTDHRLFLLADVAREGLAARKARAEAKRKMQVVPATVVPNRRSVPQGKNSNREAMSRLNKSGSIEDALKVDFE